ncbi:TetR/AcrR family transcriptional regulator [Zobellia galactanivorans]|uniref:TetR-type transcriptional regulator n=1 Tax=Zobellia galactanivorans (strain DSM 12802 / CCUG 47099 / CIP 106680 / NCIMB 13871 / Dsij) TaxID=63186 RepID=G0L327_ZOBGA|nr:MULTISPECIES: TetR/AcrR family transcriptional regulator [Zobellia]MBU3024963.1 TetR/AcrR family transcriptional regulator [Zobellia galactanivorans]MDO6808741.1 TetR/AcrR family transcriptional regulator [Zobellia galactanivorans]OWW25717.1 TetR family transcriptional regulator [Zobellia sp. OII3]CAZ98347.1 TetR-type transcriptional regulator [Zobellia galactanivorans]
MIRSEKTRQLIIEKTASIFNKKGYTGTYLSDLTKATGLTKGSIYGNFKDKNEVALEAFRYNYKFQTRQILDKIEKENKAIDKLIAFLNHYKTSFKPIFKNGGCAILNTAVDSDDGNDLLNKEVVKTIHNWHHKVTSILEDGVNSKELKEIDVNQFSYRMISMIEGSILLAKTLNKPEILLNNIAYLETEILQLKQE